MLTLFRRELHGEALRNRTWWIRIGFALLLSLVFYQSYEGLRASVGGVSANPVADLLGRGRGLFDLVVNVLFLGNILILPGLMAPAVAGERERGSLDLIRTTRVTPGGIILQKYLSRMVPMLTLLSAAFPLLTFCYAFGGVDDVTLLTAFLLLPLAVVQLGALSLLISTVCRTSAAGNLHAYAAAILFYFVLPDLFEVVPGGRGFLDPWSIYLDHGGKAWGGVLLACLPTVISILIFLVMSRWRLTRQPLVGETARRPETLMEKGLPEGHPILWRENSQGFFPRPRILMRLLFLGAFVMMMKASVFRPLPTLDQDRVTEFCIYALWFLTIVVVLLQGTRAVTSERVNRTLDVLLTTPVGGREVLRQKVAILRRTHVLMAMVFLPLVLIEMSWESEMTNQRTAAAVDAGTYFLGSILVVVVNIALLHAVALWFGLRVTNPGRALRAAFVAVSLWIAVPLALAYLILAFAHGFHPFSFVAFLSPFAIVYVLENSFWPVATGVWVPILFHVAGFGGMAFALHRFCMQQADSWLQRT